ncbi:MAG: PD-(D/E)XK nuclease family protein [Cytophagaceae bacterium]
MKMDVIQDSLYKIKSIISSHNEKLDSEGLRFNIFSILNISSNEVRLHSNLIAELLSRNGTHGMKDSFCRSFFKLFPFEQNNIISNFNYDNYIVEVEKYTGIINEDYTSGGRLDIVITDNSNNRVIIENKIFAGDQKNQLLRYYNFDKRSIILYLTLEGTEPSIWSTNNTIHNSIDFHCISYRYFISNWLIECMELSKEKPRINQIINQYLQIVKNYSNPNYNNLMTNEIVNIISTDKELYMSIDEIVNSYNVFRRSISDKFWEQLRLKKPNGSIVITQNNIVIKLDIDEDNEGFYIGFYLEKNNQRIKGTDESVAHIADKLLDISPKFIKNDNYIGWIFSNTFRKFWHLDKEKIFDLNNPNSMNSFTDEIVNEVDNYIFKINELLK